MNPQNQSTPMFRLLHLMNQQVCSGMQQDRIVYTTLRRCWRTPTATSVTIDPQANIFLLVESSSRAQKSPWHIEKPWCKHQVVEMCRFCLPFFPHTLMKEEITNNSEISKQNEPAHMDSRTVHHPDGQAPLSHTPTLSRSRCYPQLALPKPVPEI
jgi:hypothetical protein